MTNKALIALSKVKNLSYDRFSPISVRMKDSLSSQLEAASGSIFMFEDILTNEVFVVKVKSDKYCVELEKIVNQDHTNDSKRRFFDGCILYQTQYTHIREATIYAYNDSFIQAYTPDFLGSICTDGNVYLIMKYIDFADQVSLEDKTNKAIRFLAELHSRFFKKYYELNSIGLNILSSQLFEDNKNLAKSICENAIELSVLPLKLAYDIRDYISRVSNEFEKMEKSGLSFCHCDFAFRNMSFCSDLPIIIDWELSTALEPQYDIIQFLVDYPRKLDSNIIEDIVNIYINHATYCSKEVLKNNHNFQISMLRNLYHYFCFRLAALIVIDKMVPIGWINDSIRNYISIWEYLNKETRLKTN